MSAADSAESAPVDASVSATALAYAIPFMPD
jgi:hypothetical protein